MSQFGTGTFASLVDLQGVLLGRPSLCVAGDVFDLRSGDEGSLVRIVAEMEPAPELVGFMERLYRLWEARDAEMMSDATSRHPGTVFIGSDPGEWWTGHSDILAMFGVQLREMPPFHFDVEEIVAWKALTVGWIAARAMLIVEGMPSVLTRSSVVVREEGAYWRVVHWHVSIPVANEDSVGVELTTTVDEILTLVHDEPPPLTATAADGSVTIMFTDIEGSTALMESLGEPAWLELLDWHDHTVKQQTALFGGTVVKGLGDGFMLAFPAIGSAAACAVAIQHAIGTGWAGVPVAVRIGMHAGNAKVEGGDFFGRTVVIAARVAGAAAGGEILTTQIVQQGLGGVFPLGPSRSLSLKGMADHHTVFPLHWS